MTLVPKSFDVPEDVAGDGFRLRKLMAKDATQDYEAVMSSVDIIHTLRGGEWPTKGLTLEEDMIDLAWHQREFEMKLCFAYAVVDLNNVQILGCVYLYPPCHPFNGSPGFDKEGADVIVNMWVTNKAYAKGLYPKLWALVGKWLKEEWPFQNAYFSNIIQP